MGCKRRLLAVLLTLLVLAGLMVSAGAYEPGETVGRVPILLRTSQGDSPKNATNQDSALGNAAAEAARTWAGTDLVILNGGDLGADLQPREVTWEEIKDLDNGSWFDPMYREIRIPTLAQVLELAHGKIKLNIEIKPTGHEKHLEESVAALLEEYHMTDSCVVSSMKYESLEKVKQANPEIQTAYITSVSYGNFTELEYADGYSVESMMLTQRFVNQAHRAGKAVYVWTVNSEDRLEQVISMGVDNVVTDDPVMARQLIYEEEHTTFWDLYIRKLLKLSD